MTNWNKRLAELQAKQSEKPLTNKELFESEEYRDFTQKAAEDMVNGICGYLRRQGFHITEAQEDERVRSIKMDIHYAEDDMTTAFTDGAHIGINAGNKMLAPLKKQELRHFAVQGFRVHEIGHVIFSDFPTTQAWLCLLYTSSGAPQQSTCMRLRQSITKWPMKGRRNASKQNPHLPRR